MEKTTAAALSTYPGRSAVSLIRLTGPDAVRITLSLFETISGKKISDPEPRHQYYGEIKNGNKLIDRVMVSFFKSSASYTGEDMAEISCHGSPLISSMILKALYDKGCIAAEPGEFTRRAFMNAKMGLSEAEAVADLIAARSPAAAAIALSALKGREQDAVERLRSSLIGILSSLETDIDFAYEDIEQAGRLKTEADVGAAAESIKTLLKNCEAGLIIKEGVKISIAGRPNTGKSSLLNAMLGSERAIVADIPGTTRDTIEAMSEIEGLPVRFMDTAGIRQTSDPVEAEGVRRAEAEISAANLVLLVIDSSVPLNENDASIAAAVKNAPVIAVLNKSDLAHAFSQEEFAAMAGTPCACVRVSAKTGTGIHALTEEIKKVIIGDMGSHMEDIIIANERHRQALLASLESAESALAGIRADFKPELAAIDVKRCAESLALITGKIASDDVLNDIFSKFCIGK